MIKTLLLAIAALAVAVLSARWLEEGDHWRPMRGQRHCAAVPDAIKMWSFTNRARQPADRANLERWVQEHPDEVNRHFGAFCWTPLQTAARFGREDLAELILSRGADTNARDDRAGATALHLAAQYGETAVARVLVSRNADVNASTKFGRTPLHEAAFGLAGTSDLQGRLNVATLLIGRGADVNARQTGSGRTPLDEAAGAPNNQAMIELLRGAGAAQ